LAMAQQAGVTLISRAKGQRLLVLNGGDKVIFDAIPELRRKNDHRGVLR